MKKILSLLLLGRLLLGDSTLSIDPPTSNLTKQYQFYLDLGTLYIFPQLGAGFRQQRGYWGYDLNFKRSQLPIGMAWGSPLIRATTWIPCISGSARFLYYPKPDLKSQWYMGGGVSTYYFINANPSLVLGKSYQTASGRNRFWQVSTDIIPGSSVPVVSFSYGFCL